MSRRFDVERFAELQQTAKPYDADWIELQEMIQADDEQRKIENAHRQERLQSLFS